MTPSRKNAASDDAPGVLGPIGDIDSPTLGFLPTRTEQVSVILPQGDDDDLLDDEVVADEIDTAPSDVDEVDELESAVEAEIIETGPVYASLTTGSTAIVDADADADEAEDVSVEVVSDEVEVEVEDVPEARDAREAIVAPDLSVPVPVRSPPPAPAAPPPPPAVAEQASAARAEAGVSAVTGPQDTRWARAHPDDPHHEDRVHAVERVNPPREVSLSSRRIGEFEPHRESADLLTADRLLDPQHARRAEPEGGWQQFVYAVTGGRVNLGDGRRARERKELSRRIATALPGAARFVPVLSRKGGVGKTTVTTLLGMALADARDDRVIAVDANPDRGTLADRFARSSGRTVRDLVRRGRITDFHELSTIVARDETRLDVLASDADPRVSEAFSDRDYHDVAAITAHYYSIVVTDTGTGVVHSVMGATLDLADQIVVVAGLSVDEARLASEMLTWLETNGYAAQAHEAVVVLNNARPGSPLIRRGELEAHFRTRARTVVNLPYDPAIAAGGAISFRELQPATRQAAREIAAAVVGGLAQSASAA